VPELRKPIAILSAALLLASNFAGWVHVHQVAVIGVSVEPQVELHHSHCCHHSGDATSQRDTESEQEDGSPEVPGAPHDPEDCSTCRLLYTLGQTADLSCRLDRAHFESLVTDEAVLVSDFVACQWNSRPHSARGPPLL
jgi:hypothetical protein